MNILLLDCETNGKPKDYKASVKDVDNWPRVIQLAWQLVNEWGDKVISKGNYFIKPDGWTVPNEEFWITHNLTQERCVSEGIPIRMVLNHFISDVEQANFIVAHNLEFDQNCVGAEMVRQDLKVSARPPGQMKICTMQATVNYCKLTYNPKQKRFPGQNYKWPKLIELMEHLWPGSTKDQTHHAPDDVDWLKLCFFELVRRHVIKLPK
jgi:DNA polymerase III alpha subunit (gram-positive type)